jgi:hypothetical protein
LITVTPVRPDASAPGLSVSTKKHRDANDIDTKAHSGDNVNGTAFQSFLSYNHVFSKSFPGLTVFRKMTKDECRMTNVGHPAEDGELKGYSDRREK